MPSEMSALPLSLDHRTAFGSGLELSVGVVLGIECSRTVSIKA